MGLVTQYNFGHREVLIEEDSRATTEEKDKSRSDPSNSLEQQSNLSH